MDPSLQGKVSVLDIVFYTFIISIAVIVTVGNFLVILSMLLRRYLRTPPNMYLGSLAFIDLSVGVFILPLRIVQVMHNQEWKFGRVLCEIYVTMDVTLCALSIYHLIAIGLDRYRAIKEGVQYVQNRSFTSVAVTIGFLWVLCLWISTPPALGWHEDDWGLKPDNVTGIPKCVLTRTEGYVLHSSLGSLIFPMIIVSYLYYKMYVEIQTKLRKRRQAHRDLQLQMLRTSEKKINEETSEDDASSEDVLGDGPSNGGETLKRNGTLRLKLKQLRGHFTLPRQGCQTLESTATKPNAEMEELTRRKIKFSLTRERHAAKTLGIITGAFLVCWLPFTITYMTDAFFFPLADTVWFEIFSWLGYLNSAMNPFIYIFYNKEFSKAFSSILCCR